MVLFGKAKELHIVKMADVYHAYWSKFPSQSEASIRFLFRDQVCFSTSLLNLMYLSIFVRVAKNLALYPRFMLSIQHVSIVVHNLWKKCIRYFYSQCAFNNVGHIWFMSSSRCSKRLRTSVTQNLFTSETCIQLKNPFLCQFLTKNFHFGITRKLKKFIFYKTIWFWRAVQRKIVLRLENMRGNDRALNFSKPLNTYHFPKLL